MLSKLQWTLYNYITSTPQVSDIFHPEEKMNFITKLKDIDYQKIVESNFNLTIRSTEDPMGILKSVKKKLQHLFDYQLEFSEFPGSRLIITKENEIYLSYYNIHEILCRHETPERKSHYKQKLRSWLWSLLGEIVQIGRSLPSSLLKDSDFSLTNFEEESKNKISSGVLYRGWFADEEVIIKFARQDDVFYECKLLLSMSHPHIVRCFGIVHNDKLGYGLVLEYCSSESLASKTEESIENKTKWIKQIISALQYIHSKGYAHLALEPCNVLVNSQQNAKLIDFTTARKLPIQESVFKQLSYASSEQIIGDVRSTKSDNYSLSMLIYYLLLQQVPFAHLVEDCNDKRHFLYHIRNMKYRPHIHPDFEVAHPRLAYVMRDLWREKPSKRLSLKAAIELLS